MQMNPASEVGVDLCDYCTNYLTNQKPDVGTASRASLINYPWLMERPLHALSHRHEKK